jgi:mono/diheme cytochrome c family protein
MQREGTMREALAHRAARGCIPHAGSCALLPPIVPALFLAASLLSGCSEAPHVGVAGTPGATLRDAVAATLSSRCTGCHGADAPAAGMPLTEDRFEHSLVNVWSYVNDNYLLVAPGAPEKSFLIRVLRGEADIHGPHAPPGVVHLSDEELDLIERWISSLSNPGQTGAEERAH